VGLATIYPAGNGTKGSHTSASEMEQGIVPVHQEHVGVRQPISLANETVLEFHDDIVAYLVVVEWIK
jgi:hypothetical protein